jgi:hypothetical protein
MSDRLKIAICFILTFSILSSIVDAATRIVEFHARREQNTVIIEWATEEESNLSKFEIERSTDGLRWFKVGEIPAVGESTKRNSYSYTDYSIFKGSITSLYYHLVLIDNEGNTQVYDVIASVEGNSGIRHTWGSIKAMFR